MAISLTPEQQARLSAYVARGDFPSVEEAARQFINERIADHPYSGTLRPALGENIRSGITD